MERASSLFLCIFIIFFIIFFIIIIIFLFIICSVHTFRNKARDVAFGLCHLSFTR
jgi:hypothetical protein